MSSYPLTARIDMDIAMGVVALAFIFLVLLLLALNGIQFYFYYRKKGPEIPPQENLDLDLEATPVPTVEPPHQRLCILGEAVAIRLVVMAPTGHSTAVDPTLVTKVLDKAYPGLGAQYNHDKPQLKVWPSQLSKHGFPPTFFRNAKVAKEDTELSRWWLVAGEVMLGKKAYLIGLALWTDEPCGLGKVNVEGFHWIQYFSVLAVNPVQGEQRAAADVEIPGHTSRGD